MVESTPTIYGSDDGEKDDQSIQEEHVEPDERDRETADEDDVHERKTMEEDQKQVPNDRANIDDQSPNPYAHDFHNDKSEDDVKEEIKDEIEELLEQADPEVLEEVAKELEIDKTVDKEPYDPYNDNRADEELTDDELALRQNRKLYAPNGKLAAMPGKKVKSVKIKSIAEKADENRDKEE